MIMQEWKQIELGKFVDIGRKKYKPTPKAGIPCIELESIEKVSGRITHTIDSSTLSSMKNKFMHGDVLFGKLRPYLRKYALMDTKGICSTEIWVLHPQQNLCTSKFLFLLVQTDKFIYTANLSCGSRMPRADWDLVANTPFSLPPIEEQRKIVEVLETWDNAITLTKQLIEQKELQKKYLMQQLLTGRTRLKGFTYEWKESRLNKIKEVVIEKGKPLTKQQLKPGTIPVIAGGQDIPYYHNCWTHDFPCITISASGAYAGFVWIHHEKIWASDCNVLYCTEYDLNFLYFCLKYQQGRLFYLQTGGAQGHVYAGEIGSLLLPNIPLKEQQAIANVLSSCDKGIDLLKQKLAKLEEQKKGLMQVLLTGKVRLK